MTDETQIPRDSFAEKVLSNCTTSLPLKADAQSGDNGHTIVFGPRRTGMSRGDYSPLQLTAAEVTKVKVGS